MNYSCFLPQSFLLPPSLTHKSTPHNPPKSLYFHHRGARNSNIKGMSASSSSSRVNEDLIDRPLDAKPFSIVEEHRAKPPFTLKLPRNTNPTPQKLGSGMILWKNYITLSDQVEIVNICQEYGVGRRGFYQPRWRSGVKLQLQMMSFGYDWHPHTRSFNFIDNLPPKLPDFIKSLVETSIQDSVAHLNSEDEITMLNPDMSVVKFYPTTGRHVFHQDPKNGFYERAVVSISIGDSAIFSYGHSKRVNKADEVLLESGDVLIFGGKSRYIYHGVKRVIPNSAVPSLLKHTMLKPGYLNLIVKEHRV